jgi:phospholipid transport system substrate-binding protein
MMNATRSTSVTRRRSLLVAGLWVAATAVIIPVRYARAGGAIAPDKPLRALHTALEATMRAGEEAPFSGRFDALAPVVDQVFDLTTVLKISVGPRWDSIDDDLRARLLKAYRRFTVATYVASFDKNDSARFQILPDVRDAGTDRIVSTEIVDAEGQHTRLDYVMRNDNGTWRIVDVLLDGSISRVAVQRSDFRRILAAGNVDALIASLQRKTADLSGGALSS